ncbi:MAG: hypothetical protein HY766_07745 [candidate division NC10 bacterium]|nr:hypothetical protein [candidate division NC10 bacterium]
MRIHAALDSLIELEWRVARLYTRFYRRFCDLPAVAGIWWEMALDEHEHVGVLTMVKELADPKGRVADIRHRLRPLQDAINACERAAAKDVTLSQALAMAVHLERSELDRLGRETVRAIGGDLPPIPRSAFAPHEAHLERLMRTVRKFGGEDVARDAWDLRPEARLRSRGPLAGRPSRVGTGHAGKGKGRARPEKG